MKAISTLLVQLINLVMRLLGPGGTRSVIAENLLLRHQLAVLNRNRKRAPNLQLSDRVALGLISQWINPHRLRSVAIIVQPATILKFHRALVRRKYQRLFNAKNQNKPGPSGPFKELIEAIVEIKQRNPRLVRINTLFQHSEKYRNPQESPVTASFRCLIHELNELSIRNSAICL